MNNDKLNIFVYMFDVSVMNGNLQIIKYLLDMCPELHSIIHKQHISFARDKGYIDIVDYLINIL